MLRACTIALYWHGTNPRAGDHTMHRIHNHFLSYLSHIHCGNATSDGFSSNICTTRRRTAQISRWKQKKWIQIAHPIVLCPRRPQAALHTVGPIRSVSPRPVRASALTPKGFVSCFPWICYNKFGALCWHNQSLARNYTHLDWDLKQSRLGLHRRR